eukprot:scaffold120975_cov66-Phaeocystis_antarctica.AAC.3
MRMRLATMLRQHAPKASGLRSWYPHEAVGHARIAQQRLRAPGHCASHRKREPDGTACSSLLLLVPRRRQQQWLLEDEVSPHEERRAAFQNPQLRRRNLRPHLKPASRDTGSPVRLHELSSLPRCADNVHACRHIPAERAKVVDGELLNAAEGLDLFACGSAGHPGALSTASSKAHAGRAAAGTTAKHLALDDHDDARHAERGRWFGSQPLRYLQARFWQNMAGRWSAPGG